MNILCLTDAFWPDHTGGISKTVISEVDELVSQGNKVIAVSRRMRRDGPRYEALHGYELYRYPGPESGSAFDRLYPLVTRFLLPRMLRRIIRDHQVDVAYVNNVFQADAFLGMGNRIPMMYVFHASAHREISIDLQEGKYGSASKLAALANIYVKRAERRVISGAHSVLVRSEFMRHELSELYSTDNKGRVWNLPLGVDTKRFAYAEDQGRVRRELALDEKRPLLLTVRRLVGRMGIENLILAMRTVTSSFPNALLIIGGIGYMEEKFREMIIGLGLENNISMVGFIPEEMLPKYYQAADLFVLPTLEYEGFGRSTIEALSCGTPSIVTPVGANPEVVAPLGNEFLFKSTTPSAISEGIKVWLEKRGSMEDRGKCRSYCVARFHQGEVCRRLAGLLGRDIGKVSSSISGQR